MATLFDQLQARLAGQTAEAPKAQQQSILESIRSRTGKAAPGAGVKQSALGEQAAVATGTQQLQQQQQQGVQAAAQLGEQAAGLKTQDELAAEALASKERQATATLDTQGRVQRGAMATGEELAGEQRTATNFIKLGQMTQKYDQTLQTLATQRGITTDRLFSSYDRETAKLDLEKKDSDLAQILAAATLSNKKYVQDLAQYGSLKRLTDKNNFDKELGDLVYGKTLNQQAEEYSFLRDFNMDNRQYEKNLKQLSVDQRISLYKTAAQGAKDRLVFDALLQGGGTVAAYKPAETPAYSGPSSSQVTNNKIA